MARLALFDLDKTVLSINSGTFWVRREVRQGYLGKRQALKAAAWLTRYHFGFASAESMVEEAVRHIEGSRGDELKRRTEQFFVEEVRGRYRPGALEAIARHKAEGARLVMLTSSSNYLSELVAAELGFDRVLCNVLEVDPASGLHTGRIAGGVCFGAGKVKHARRESEASGLTLTDAVFYTDSFSDLPVMEIVGEPVAVNPDVRLRRHAQSRGWKVVDWGQERDRRAA